MDGISIIVPTLNREKYLSNTVGYLVSQVFDKPYEIIIVDQSVEANQDMLNLHEKLPDKVRYYHAIQFKGLPEARNFGVQHSKYDFVLFLDDDIECGSHLLKEHLNYLEQPEIAVVAGGITEKFRSNSNTKNIGKFHYFSATPESGFHIKWKGYVDHGKGCNYSIKKEVFLKAGGVDEYLNYGAALFEETELCLRVKELGYKVFFNYDAHVWHLVAATGGCRMPDICRYVASLVHNKALMISRHLRWYHQMTAYFYLLRLVSSYALTYRKHNLWRVFKTSYKEGYRKGKLKPKYTLFQDAE